MSRTRWILLAVFAIPVLVGAVVVSATLGPWGAALYLGLLLGTANTRHLFRDDHRDQDRIHRFLNHVKGPRR